MVHLVIEKLFLQRVMGPVGHGGVWVWVLVMSEREQVEEEHMLFV